MYLKKRILFLRSSEPGGPFCEAVQRMYIFVDTGKRGVAMAAEYVWETAEEMDLNLAKRVRRIRKRRSVSQEKLSKMSGVSFGSIKRFETTGKISLLSLTKIAVALECGDEIREMFTQIPYRNIEEVIRDGR